MAVSVSVLAVALIVLAEPVNQCLADLSLRAKLAVGYCTHRTHSVFCPQMVILSTHGALICVKQALPPSAGTQWPLTPVPKPGHSVFRPPMSATMAGLPLRY